MLAAGDQAAEAAILIDPAPATGLDDRVVQVEVGPVPHVGRCVGLGVLEGETAPEFAPTGGLELEAAGDHLVLAVEGALDRTTSPS